MKKILAALILSILLTQPSFGKQKLDLALYETMYKSFIYTDDINSAYIVAEKVLKTMPRSLKWRKRVAQLSLWLGKTDKAYKDYLYIYKKTKDPSIEKLLFSFPYPEVVYLKIKNYEKQIKKGNYKNSLKLVRLYEYEGYPEKSIKLLKYVYKKTKKENYFYEYIKYAIKLGESRILVKYTKKLRTFPIKEKYSVAYLLIAQGDYEKALEIMRYVKKLPKDKVYYNILLFLLLKTQNYNKFIKITKFLLIKEKVDISYVYPLLDYYYRKKDFQTLEIIYSKLYKIKRTKDILKGYIDVLLHDKHYKKTLKIIKENQSLFSKQEYLFYMAKIYAGLKYKEKVAKIYEILLRDYRKQLTLNEKKEILWFLIDNANRYYEILKRYLPFFEKEDDLYMEVINAYMRIQELDKAQSIAKKYINQEKDNLSFLILYADILNIKSVFDESYYYYHKAWILANNKLKFDPKLIREKEFLRNYIRLSYMFEKPDKIRKLFRVAKEVLKYNEYINLKLDYYLYKGEYEPAFYINNYRRLF